MADGDLPCPPVTNLVHGNPFATCPMFGDLAKAAGRQGPLNWDAARQFALDAATEGAPEPTSTPRCASAGPSWAASPSCTCRPSPASTPSFPESCPSPRACGPSARSTPTGRCYRAGRRAAQRPAGDDRRSTAEPMIAMMAGLIQMLGPRMLGMSVGSMIGRLAPRTSARTTCPSRAASHEVMVVPPTSTASPTTGACPSTRCGCGCSPELTATRCSPSPRCAPRSRPDPALRRRVPARPAALPSGWRRSRSAWATRAALQRLFGDPAVLLGAMTSPAQKALVPQLDAAGRRRPRLRRPHGRPVAARASVATRCASPRPCAAVVARPHRTTCSSSGCSACRCPAPGAAGQRLRGGRRRARGRGRAEPAVAGRPGAAYTGRGGRPGPVAGPPRATTPDAVAAATRRGSRAGRRRPAGRTASGAAPPSRAAPLTERTADAQPSSTDAAEEADPPGR